MVVRGWIVAAGIVFGVPLVASAADNAAAPGATVLRAAHVCVACHGEGGRGRTPAMPAIAGQTKTYLAAQLKDFRAQVRAEPGRQGYMWGISALLDDATIDGLAEHFAAQPASKGHPGDAAAMRLGAQIFRAGIPARGVRACVECHGAQARGEGAVPRLAGQSALYLRTQLDDFGTALRPHASDMRAQVKAMSKAEKRAVAEYLQSL